MRSLITGIDGFIGSKLVESLQAQGDEIFGITRGEERTEGYGKIYSADLVDAAAMAKVIKEVKPDRVFHLAAQSNIPNSFENPADTIDSNVTGSVNIFEAVKEYVPDCVILSIGSSAEYGLASREGGDLKEDGSLRPSSPYAITKVAQGMFGEMYSKAYDCNFRMRIRICQHHNNINILIVYHWLPICRSFTTKFFC